MRDSSAKQRAPRVRRRQERAEKLLVTGVLSQNYQSVVRGFFCFGSRRPGLKSPRHKEPAHTWTGGAELNQENLVRFLPLSSQS